MFRVTSRLRFIEPQVASAVDQPPEGKHWIHKIKHDGYRCQVLLQQGQARVFTRTLLERGRRFYRRPCPKRRFAASRLVSASGSVKATSQHLGQLVCGQHKRDGRPE
jgi:ATP-dependent DNA ligase